ncbi:MAG: GIY-YIG nuclease family protein, partial [Deltaproteobacteria bacterium]|nr:GIY-YIG nuclease family protein [Deltaproteobacteria bacterium]
GQTSNLDQRLKRHNANKGRYTKNKGPFTLVYKEEFMTRSEAMRREKFLKPGQGREYLKQVIPR